MAGARDGRGKEKNLQEPLELPDEAVCARKVAFCPVDGGTNSCQLGRVGPPSQTAACLHNRRCNQDVMRELKKQRLRAPRLHFFFSSLSLFNYPDRGEVRADETLMTDVTV